MEKTHLAVLVCGVSAIGVSRMFDRPAPPVVIINDVDRLMTRHHDFEPMLLEQPARQSFKSNGLDELNRRQRQRRDAVAEMQDAAKARKARRKRR